MADGGTSIKKVSGIGFPTCATTLATASRTLRDLKKKACAWTAVLVRDSSRESKRPTTVAVVRPQLNRFNPMSKFNQSLSSRHFIASLSFVLLTAALLPSARGASRFWTGNVNGNFATAGNWLGNVAPA